MSLIAELKQRNVLRVAAAYVAVSWLLIQVTETLFPVFGLSDGAIRTVVIVLGIGFIPAVIAASAFELTPEGIVRESDADHASPSSTRMRKNLDRLIMIALALAIGYFALDKFLLDPARDREREQAIAEIAREEGRAEAARDASMSEFPMVAVLPFEAVGSGDDSKFFAAGVHDDLLTKLAQLPALRVISRTSVMEYQDVDRNMREIGAALGADAILEGGVQSAGDRIRINAQLIDAATDEHLWAETYDRVMTVENIFDVQSEIAHAISVAMHAALNDSESGSQFAMPTRNMAAYRTWHEALIVRDSVPNGLVLGEYRDLLRKAAELDPAFTRPKAALVGSLALPLFGVDDPDAVAEIERLLQEIESVSPGSADSLIAQAYYTYYILRNYELAHALASSALEMAPSDTRLVEMKTWIERRLGQHDEMIESIRLTRKLDPRNPRWTGTLINNLFIAHRYDEAAAEFDALDALTPFMEAGQSLLDLREHGDFDRLVAEVEVIKEEYGAEELGSYLWWVYIAGRDFEASLHAAAAIRDSQHAKDGLHAEVEILGLEIISYWLLEQHDRVAEIADQMTELIASGDMRRNEARLAEARVAGVLGNTEEARRIIRLWNREDGQDAPVRINTLDYMCQVLGIAGAAEAAVDCIRTGLSEPSRLVHFADPYLPVYDSIREHPAFVELLEDISSY